ncbi:MAG: ABC transporter ATP-binding protein [Synergistaceae bacterium]|nr:ABC transporter ATP-binding protein [Synergistaceae bacterium]MBQ3398688.1 ABC transporter ATP-binding protein [Synergistaceae bacterium]MBQ6418166.1 ABC transporter ATP-binding protein [Synergistaceae bacterium]
MSDEILRVENLHTTFKTSAGEVKAVDGVSFSVNRGEVLGIAGESGSGKSTAMLSVMGLTGENSKVSADSISFMGESLSSENVKSLRGGKISMIFQDPMTSLNPVLSAGYQLEEILRQHHWKGNVRERVAEMMTKVGIVPAEERMRHYPHEFSGGQRQRLMIAMSILCDPELLIADEPTTALDVTVQAQILGLLREIREASGMGMIIITHDLGVIAGEADRVIVMYGGRIMEEGTSQEIFKSPMHPYTRGLLRSVPKPDAPRERLIPIEGQPPDLLNPPEGCPFVKRCSEAMRICLREKPEESCLSDTHKYSCWKGLSEKPYVKDDPSVSLRSTSPLSRGDKDNIAPPEKGERATTVARGLVLGKEVKE